MSRLDVVTPLLITMCGLYVVSASSTAPGGPGLRSQPLGLRSQCMGVDALRGGEDSRKKHEMSVLARCANS